MRNFLNIFSVSHRRAFAPEEDAPEPTSDILDEYLSVERENAFTALMKDAFALADPEEFAQGIHRIQNRQRQKRLLYRLAAAAVFIGLVAFIFFGDSNLRGDVERENIAQNLQQDKVTDILVENYFPNVLSRVIPCKMPDILNYNSLDLHNILAYSKKDNFKSTKDSNTDIYYSIRYEKGWSNPHLLNSMDWVLTSKSNTLGGQFLQNGFYPKSTKNLKSANIGQFFVALPELNCNDIADKGIKLPNLALFHMSGNVREYCSGFFDSIKSLDLANFDHVSNSSQFGEAAIGHFTSGGGAKNQPQYNIGDTAFQVLDMNGDAKPDILKHNPSRLYNMHDHCEEPKLFSEQESRTNIYFSRYCYDSSRERVVKSRQKSETGITNYHFNGKENDDTSTYHYFGARYFDGKESLWLSVDPMTSQIPQSISLANLCENRNSLVPTGFNHPIGTILPFAGQMNDIPVGWLFCDGQSLIKEEFPHLFDIIQYTWGAGTGNNPSEFQLPDLRGGFKRSTDWHSNFDNGILYIIKSENVFDGEDITMNAESTQHSHQVMNGENLFGSYIPRMNRLDTTLKNKPTSVLIVPVEEDTPSEKSFLTGKQTLTFIVPTQNLNNRKFKITLKNSIDNKTVYEEEQVVTNQNGSGEVKIGFGKILVGRPENVDWATDYSIKIEVYDNSHNAFMLLEESYLWKKMFWF